MTLDSDFSDQTLKERASHGEEQAFKMLFDRYHSKLFHYLFNIVKSKEVAEELVMDVFLKMWLARDMIVQIENLDGFLFRAAYNKSIDFFRAAAKDKRLTDIIWENDQIPSENYADEPLLMHEYESKLRDAIDLLSPQRKKIFLLHKDGGLSNAEIADTLSISKKTVANSIVEARQFIKSYLSKELGFWLFTTVVYNLLKNN
jgi:RNA polymerase sigma-70 factor (ECF subfamily)